MKNSDVKISDYLEWVKGCHEVKYGPNDEFSCYQDFVYFRGHASISWDLVPSLFRDYGRRHDEHKMLFQASNMLWMELSDCKSELEKMIRLQHYGLHTRLLDVTYNPLVALYFACQMPSKKEDEKDGVIYCGYKEETNNKVSQTIAEYVFNHDTISINMDELKNICEKNEVKPEDMESIYFITPPLNNPRISIQNGAFIMSPLLKKNAEVPFNNAGYAYIKGEMKTAFEKQFTIPEISKLDILKELDYLGFNKATIYADISNKLQYINEKEHNEVWKALDISDLTA